MADLKFRIPSPNPLPNWGILLTPKTKMTITRMMISSVVPIGPIKNLRSWPRESVLYAPGIVNRFTGSGVLRTSSTAPRSADYRRMRSFPRRRVNFSLSRYSSKGIACFRVISKSSLNSATPNLTPGANLALICFFIVSRIVR
jgi:hypothetical protein